VRIQSSTTANFNPNNLTPYNNGATAGIVSAANLWNEYEYAVACAGQYAEVVKATKLNLPGYEKSIEAQYTANLLIAPGYKSNAWPPLYCPPQEL
jgi:hypothetical protein